MRRAWLRGRENLHKRYLIHVAGFDLSILMRASVGHGTPREGAVDFALIRSLFSTAKKQGRAIIDALIGDPTALARSLRLS